jgi:hypothetical protein
VSATPVIPSLQSLPELTPEWERAALLTIDVQRDALDDGVDEVGAILRAQVFAGSPGTIERTSSGKPRRRVMWQALPEGALEAEPVLGP